MRKETYIREALGSSLLDFNITPKQAILVSCIENQPAVDVVLGENVCLTVGDYFASTKAFFLFTVLRIQTRIFRTLDTVNLVPIFLSRQGLAFGTDNTHSRGKFATRFNWISKLDGNCLGFVAMDRFDDLHKERMAALLRAVYATKYVKDDNVPSQIEEGLYLGSVGAANNKTLLKSLNITHILTVASSLPPSYPNDFTYKVVDVPDREEVNIAQFFDDCFGFISEAKRTGGVLVHCFVGRSRSVTIVVAYLMKTHGMRSSEALNLVKSKRSAAAPNSGFMLQLRNYENSLPDFFFILSPKIYIK
ncbi:hypothetical protein L1987_70432 [Smallanthus sonchifolius]|uniref:Uncharacterized protein n=1 Tax=Smallanthus sonchifolius TaxID=185202 RepID=A0ACB9APW0_9ASTR|nr:hypothetical protein L1987_70432 [Smallanthus sonchifolius]